jgi:hypothetical protein
MEERLMCVECGKVPAMGYKYLKCCYCEGFVCMNGRDFKDPGKGGGCGRETRPGRRYCAKHDPEPNWQPEWAKPEPVINNNWKQSDWIGFKGN